MSTAIATELEQRLVAQINAERAAEGLPALQIEAHLNASAQSHSDWMGETGTFDHTGEGGSSATDRIEDAGFPLTGSWQTAENIAFISVTGELDAGEADRMHEGLMESAGHRANMLDPNAAYVGVGLSQGSITVDGDSHDVVFLTQNFADTDGQVLVQEEVDGETGRIRTASRSGGRRSRRLPRPRIRRRIRTIRTRKIREMSKPLRRAAASWRPPRMEAARTRTSWICAGSGTRSSSRMRRGAPSSARTGWSVRGWPAWCPPRASPAGPRGR
jgi:hypothetical protein